MARTNPQVAVDVEVNAEKAKAGFNEVKQSGADMAQAVSSGAQAAAKRLDDLGLSADRAVTKLNSAEQRAANSLNRKVVNQIYGSNSPEAAVLSLQSKGIDANKLENQISLLAKSRDAQLAAAEAVKQTIPPTEKLGMTAKATAAALRQVPAQFTDIVVGLQGGQAPLTVLLQQGGQLKDVFGGVGAAARALGGYILTLLTPLNVALAAAAGLGVAFFQGRKETEEYNKALILTGNYAGTTSGKLQRMAQSISSTTGATQGAAAEALTAFAASGQVGAASLERFASVALGASKVTGQSLDDIKAKFVELGKDPVAASIKLNDQMRYLTLEVYNQIKALDDQGRSVEAAALAQKAYADTLENRTKALVGNLGLLERVWKGVTGFAKDAWDAMLNVGRTEEVETQIDRLTQKLANAQKLGDLARARGQNVSTPTLSQDDQATLDTLKETARLRERAAQATAQSSRDVETRIKFDKDSAQFATKEVKLKKELAAAENEYGLALKRGIITQTEYAQLIAGIKDKYTDKNKGPAPKDNQLEKAKADFDAEAIKLAYQAQASAISNGERILDASRSAGLVSDTDYFNSKRVLIEANAALEDKALGEQIEIQNARRVLTGTAQERELAEYDKKKKIMELEAQRAKASAGATNAVALLAIQEQSASDKIQRAWDEARQAAQAYLDTTNQGYTRSLDGIGRGDAFREQQSGRNQITDKYQNQRQELTNKFLLGKQSPEERDQYEKQLALVSEFQSKALELWDEYSKKRIAKEGDTTNGITRALENYVSESANVAKGVEDLFTSAFKGMEDALLEFTETGKLNFNKLADSIVADITRMIIKQQILAPLANSLGVGAAGGTGGGGIVSDFIGSLLGGKRAAGGPVSPGTLYQVNERGPELLNMGGKQYLMTGAQGGNITPNNKIGGQSVSVVNHFSINGEMDYRSQDQIASRVGMATQRALARNN